MHRKDVVQLRDGAVVAFQEYGDPNWDADHILPRLAELTYDGATRR